MRFKKPLTSSETITDKDMEKPPTVIAYVRGFRFKSPPFEALRDICVGDPMGLLREPENPVDVNAIVVTNVEEIPLAYIDCDSAAQLSKWMDAGWVFDCRCVTPPDATLTLIHVYIKTDSMTVRCTPIQPIALKKKTVQSIHNHRKEPVNG